MVLHADLQVAPQRVGGGGPSRRLQNFPEINTSAPDDAYTAQTIFVPLPQRQKCH